MNKTDQAKLQRAWRNRDRAISVAKDLLRILEDVNQHSPDALVTHELRISSAQCNLANLVGATRQPSLVEQIRATPIPGEHELVDDETIGSFVDRHTVPPTASVGSHSSIPTQGESQ